MLDGCRLTYRFMKMMVLIAVQTSIGRETLAACACCATQLLCITYEPNSMCKAQKVSLPRHCMCRMLVNVDPAIGQLDEQRFQDEAY